MYWNDDWRDQKGYEWRLIETWDVLKWGGSTRNDRRGTGLIETWDVLK